MQRPFSSTGYEALYLLTFSYCVSISTYCNELSYLLYFYKRQYLKDSWMRMQVSMLHAI